jgi:DNA-binding CsgD family transcriptional regulator
MWVQRNYTGWLEFVRDLLADPSPGFPRAQVQQRLSNTLDAMVSWNWEDPDGTYGVVLPPEIQNWPSAELIELWESHVRDVHPLLRWYAGTEDPRPMSLGRVPSQYVAPGAMELTREFTASIGVDQQLSIPCHVGHGHRAFVAVQSGDDFSDDALQLARLIQPLLALLWLQGSASERCRDISGGFGLTGRERAVLQLLADGLTAEAIACRLGISPRTVHSHLAHLYRKLGVCDRMRAVLVGHSAGLVTVSARILDRHAI